MKAYLSRRYRLSASHRLHSELYDDERNRAVYGKCNNPFGHGHNYVVEVTMSGSVDARSGMVCDLGELDGFMQKEVVDRFNHTNLNLLEDFQGLVPTTENLCVAVYDLISTKFVKATLVRVRIEETLNNFFEYSGREAHSIVRST